MYRDELVESIRQKYRGEAEFNLQLINTMDMIKTYMQFFQEQLERTSELSSLKLKITDNRIDINDCHLEFVTDNKSIKVNVGSVEGVPSFETDEFIYKDGIFRNPQDNPITFELMDEYLRRAFEGKWDKNQLLNEYKKRQR